MESPAIFNSLWEDWKVLGYGGTLTQVHAHIDLGYSDRTCLNECNSILPPHRWGYQIMQKKTTAASQPGEDIHVEFTVLSFMLLPISTKTKQKQILFSSFNGFAIISKCFTSIVILLCFTSNQKWYFWLCFLCPHWHKPWCFHSNNSWSATS